MYVRELKATKEPEISSLKRHTFFVQVRELRATKEPEINVRSSQGIVEGFSTQQVLLKRKKEHKKSAKQAAKLEACVKVSHICIHALLAYLLYSALLAVSLHYTCFTCCILALLALLSLLAVYCFACCVCRGVPRAYADVC